MAGGIGARFWPVSRIDSPKQFIDILGTGETLIQKTVKRFQKICPKENIFIVTNELYEDLVKTQIPDILPHQIILEPARRNTAPCIAYANFKIKELNPKATIVVAPSDHNIIKEDVFTEVIQKGLDAVSQNDWLLTIGIQPNYPNTGYGYIQYNEDKKYNLNPNIYEVKTFTEKPNIEMAQQFIESGDFLWNAGIFMWSLDSINKAFENYLPEIYTLFEQGEGLYNTSGENEFIKRTYEVCRNISIDFGIMEKADNVHVFSADFGWSDLGTWGSLYDIRPKDKKLNAISGKNVRTYDTEKCIITVPDDKVVVVQGLEDYIITESKGVLLICKKENEQNIRQYSNDVQLELGEKYS